MATPDAGVAVPARTAGLVLGGAGILAAAALLWVLPAQTGAAGWRQLADPAGPGFFPLLATLIVLASSVACLLDGLKSPRSAMAGEPVHWRYAAPVAAALVGAALVMPWVGMLATVGLLVGLLVPAFGERRPLPALLLALLTPLVLYALFERVLKILFPRGWIL